MYGKRTNHMKFPIMIRKYSQVIKKNRIMPFAAMWMDVEIVIMSYCKSEKDKYIIPHRCGI